MYSTGLRVEVKSFRRTKIYITTQKIFWVIFRLKIRKHFIAPSAKSALNIIYLIIIAKIAQPDISWSQKRELPKITKLQYYIYSGKSIRKIKTMMSSVFVSFIWLSLYSFYLPYLNTVVCFFLYIWIFASKNCSSKIFSGLIFDAVLSYSNQFNM